MPRMMKFVTALSFVAAIITTILFHCSSEAIYLTLAISFGTTAYHLGARLLVGLLYNTLMQNRADYTRKWYQIRPWEAALYRAIKIKKWKDKMPTYQPESFSPQKHTWDEIAQAMCQSELVHETNVILSFLPLAASIPFGSFYVFLITSVCGALFDSLFVMIQRYNRPRVVKIALRQRCPDAANNRISAAGTN